MKRTIEIKHVGPKAQVKRLIEELIDRLGEKLQHVAQDALSFHAVFDANGDQTLYHMSVTGHLPGHTVVAHEESRDSGEAIRKAFGELERQLEKPLAVLRQEPLKRRSARQRQVDEARFEARP